MSKNPNRETETAKQKARRIVNEAALDMVAPPRTLSGDAGLSPETRALMRHVYEPIYIDEETLKAAAEFKLPAKYQESMNRAAERVRAEFKRQGGVLP